MRTEDFADRPDGLRSQSGLCYIISMNTALILLFLIVLIYGGAAVVLRMTYRRLL